MVCIILLIIINMCNSYSLSYSSRINLRKDIYFNVNNEQIVKKYDQNIFYSINEIFEQKENYCFISTISHEEKIKNYPYGSITGFAVNDDGYPILALSDISQHSQNIKNNNSVSIVITDKMFNGLNNRRLVITGNLKKINNNIVNHNKYDKYDCDEIPSKKTLDYKQKYLTMHPRAHWVEFPDIYMYVLNSIKDIYFIQGFGSAQKVDIEQFINYFKNKRYINE